MCKTKPILRLRIWDCGLRIQERPAAGRPCGPPARAACPNKPNRPERIMGNEPNSRLRRVGRDPGGGGRGANASNKAKLRRVGVSGGRGDRAGQFCQTKPIRRAVRRLRRVTCTNKANPRRTKKKGKCSAGKELWLMVHSIGLGKTKPKGSSRWSVVSSRLEDCCAKQTQFGPAWAEPRPRWAKDAKQSQFPATPGGTWPLGREPWGYRATSPRCPASGNKANYHRSSRSDGGGIRHRMPATPCRTADAF
jgi:hypothetical protein